MSKSQIVSKVRRVLHLFFGMRHPAVAKALVPFGHSQGVMREGWNLLQVATKKSMDATATGETESELLAHVAEFEDTWFPIARSVLERTQPGAASALLQNLSRESGREVTLNVAIFLERLAEMPQTQGSFGASGRAARKALADRGLSLEVEQQARAWLDSLALAREPRVPTASAEDERAALDALWLWYREWSAICRVAIKDRALLRKLGFRKNKSLEEEIEDEPIVAAPAVGTGNSGIVGAPTKSGSLPPTSGIVSSTTTPPAPALLTASDSSK